MPRQIIKTGQVAENRKARFNYTVEDTVEAGLSLTGAEVKSARYGLANISDGFVANRGGNLVLKNVVFQQLPTVAKIAGFDERRGRQLLLTAAQIRRMIGKLNEKGATVFPLKLYFNSRGKLKVLLGIGFGKNRADKRETIKKRDIDREIRRQL
jgi:SsrA-binding protein